MSAFRNGLACSLIYLAAIQPALAADPWYESFNKVSIVPWRNSGFGGLAAGTSAIDGIADFEEFSRTVASGGTIIWHGSADFDDLKIYMEQIGVVADHRATAISHQILNVSDPTVAPGTAGTMYLSYSFGGFTKIDGGPENSVSYSLSVTQDVSNSGIGGTLLEFVERTTTISGSAATGISNVNATVPFVYGDDFRITTRFDVRIQSELELTPSTGTTFVGIVAAFDNSATLDAVYIPEGASISLASISGFDLGALTHFGTPVPLPLPIALFLSALVPLACLMKRKVGSC